jgi:hypothetical protein
LKFTEHFALKTHFFLSLKIKQEWLCFALLGLAAPVRTLTRVKNRQKWGMKTAINVSWMFSGF